MLLLTQLPFNVDLRRDVVESHLILPLISVIYAANFSISVLLDTMLH